MNPGFSQRKPPVGWLSFRGSDSHSHLSHRSQVALGDTSPFFPGILLSRNPPLKSRQNGQFLEGTVEKNGESESTPRSTSKFNHMKTGTRAASQARG